MKKFYGMFLIFLAVMGADARADRFLSVEMSPEFHYQDSDKACSIDDTLRLFFLARLSDDGKVVEAKFGDIGRSLPKEVKFLTAELPGIELIPDGVGEFWVQKLPVSARLLNWIFFNLAGIDLNGPGVCRPKRALATLDPNGFTFEFIQKSAGEFVTATKRFQGLRIDGKPYSVQLKFHQRPWSL